MGKGSTRKKWTKPNLRIEADYIIRRAKEGASRIVTLGSVILFSTTTGDAWMLDTDGNLALCLARDGDRQPFRIMEDAKHVAVEWNQHFAIVDGRFTSMSNTGRISSITGYPTKEIAKAIHRISTEKK
jgi:hypothetical protein